MGVGDGGQAARVLALRRDRQAALVVRLGLDAFRGSGRGTHARALPRDLSRVQPDPALPARATRAPLHLQGQRQADQICRGARSRGAARAAREADPGRRLSGQAARRRRDGLGRGGARRARRAAGALARARGRAPADRRRPRRDDRGEPRVLLGRAAPRSVHRRGPGRRGRPRARRLSESVDRAGDPHAPAAARPGRRRRPLAQPCERAVVRRDRGAPRRRGDAQRGRVRAALSPAADRIRRRAQPDPRPAGADRGACPARRRLRLRARRIGRRRCRVGGAMPRLCVNLVNLSERYGTGVPLELQLEAAANAGAKLVGLETGGIRRWLAEGRTLEALRGALERRGLQCYELTYLECASSQAQGSLAATEKLASWAGAIGCEWILTASLDEPVSDALADLFGRACDVAARHGTGLAWEFFPWAKIDHFAAAHELVRRAGRRNAGVLLDCWHFFNGPDDWS